MQITLLWTCRHCGAENRTPTDTAYWGTLQSIDNGHGPEYFCEAPKKYDLVCADCARVSGGVGLAYQFLEEHRPSHEREITE